MTALGSESREAASRNLPGPINRSGLLQCRILILAHPQAPSTSLHNAAQGRVQAHNEPGSHWLCPQGALPAGQVVTALNTLSRFRHCPKYFTCLDPVSRINTCGSFCHYPILQRRN